MSRRTRGRILLAAVVATAAALRLWDLAADPSPFKRGGDIADEGYWMHDPRLWALGMARADEVVHADAGGPLHALLVRASFWLFGPGFAAARLPSAIAGVALVAVLAIYARRAWGERSMIAAAAIAGLGEAAIAYSRLCLPEMLQTTLLACALLALLAPGRWRPWLAGAALSLALLAKVTTLLYAPGLAAALCWSHRGPDRLRQLGAFTMACTVGPAVWALAVLAPNADAYLAHWTRVAQNDSGGRLFAIEPAAVVLGYFNGFPSVALATIAAAAVVITPTLRRERSTGALLAFCGSFLALVALSADKTDRRWVPLMGPLALLAARALTAARHRGLGRSPFGPLVLVALAASGVAAAWRGCLSEALGDGALRFAAAILLAGAAIGVVAWCLRARSIVGVAGLSIAAAALALPTLAATTRRTHSERDASVHLAGHFGNGCFVTGPFAHALAIEAAYYPLFLAPGGKGIREMNARFDRRRLDGQLRIVRLESLWGPLGLGRVDPPARTGSLYVLPDFLGRMRFEIDVYAWNAPCSQRREDTDSEPMLIGNRLR